MRFNKAQGQFLADVIGQWQNGGTIDSETAKALKDSFSIRPFDWAKLAMYSFIVAIVCAIIAVTVLVADDFLVELIERFYSAPDSAVCLLFGGLAAVAFYVGLRKRRSRPQNVFGNEAILFVGVLFTALSISFLGKILDSGSGHFSLLLLFAAVVYGVLGYWFGSSLVWVFSLLSIGSWFGAETGYASGWGAYFFGMNYPLRFVFLGAVLAGGSFLLKRYPKAAFLQGPTYSIGLLYLFLSLWILSIFGNYGDWDSWSRSTMTDLLQWSVLFGLVAVAVIWYGLKCDDATSRGFGLTFLFINLYTKYFEYFWNSMHKAVFFLILAVSFWLIGRKAEAIWNLEFVKKEAGRDDGESQDRHAADAQS